jgi:hypothetical protein
MTSWVLEGDTIRVLRASDRRSLSIGDRLKIFDEATARQKARNKAWRRQHGAKGTADRGWTRDEIYTRGRPR